MSNTRAPRIQIHRRTSEIQILRQEPGTQAYRPAPRIRIDDMNIYEDRVDKRPIHVCWDSSIDNAGVEAIMSTIDDIISIASDREIVRYGSMEWSTGDYSSADWYIDNARKRPNGQANAKDILYSLSREPLQSNPHIDILVTNSDLYVDNDQYLFGLSIKALGTSVNSFHRFNHLDKKLKNLCINRLILHELGHVLGMASPDRAHTVNSGGPHCTNPGCTMRQGLSVSEWIKLAREEQYYGKKFCPECMAEILGRQ